MSRTSRGKLRNGVDVGTKVMVAGGSGVELGMRGSKSHPTPSGQVVLVGASHSSVAIGLDRSGPIVLPTL